MSRFSIRAVAVLAVGGLLVIVLAPSAWGYCPSVPFSKQVRKSDAVWLGTIISAEPIQQSANGWRLRVRVERVLHGTSQDGRVEVLTGFAGPFISRRAIPDLRRMFEGSRNVFAIFDEGGLYWRGGRSGCGGLTPPGEYLALTERILHRRSLATEEPLAPVADEARPWVVAGAVVALTATAILALALRAEDPA